MVSAAVVLTSCGSGSTTTESTDSTAVEVQNHSVTANDSTTSQIPSGGASSDDRGLPIK